jgi:hypothetical protein
MAISDSQKVDLLVKKLAGVTKTDRATNKDFSNETIASPALIRGDKIWTQADRILSSPRAVEGIVEEFPAIKTRPDITAKSTNQIYPTWLTDLTNWIPPEFGSGYLIKVYFDNDNAADPKTTGTQLFAAGDGGRGEWYFDYQAGVLNFIGDNLPPNLTADKFIYIYGYRYVGSVGIGSLSQGTLGDITITGDSITSNSASGDINLNTSNNGQVKINNKPAATQDDALLYAIVFGG